MKTKAEIRRAMEICRLVGIQIEDEKKQEMYLSMGTALSWVLECRPDLCAQFDKGLDAAEALILQDYREQSERN